MTQHTQEATRKLDEISHKASENIDDLKKSASPRMQEIMAGFMSAVVGVQHSLKNDQVQAVYFKWAKSFLKILVPMYIVAIILIIMFIPLVAIFPGIVLQLLSLIPFWATYFNKKVIKFGSQLFFLELSTKNPSLSAELSAMASARAREPKSWFKETTADIRSSWHFSKYSLGLAALSAIPLLGPAVAFFGQTLLVADRLGYNLLSVYTSDCRGMRYSEEKNWMRARKFPLMGFSVPFTLLMSIPVVGPFVGGIAQAAAADLFNDVLYQKKEAAGGIEDHPHQK